MLNRGPPLIHILEPGKTVLQKNVSWLNRTIFCTWKWWSGKIKMNYVLCFSVGPPVPTKSDGEQFIFMILYTVIIP